MLLDWKDKKSRKPLILRGARQVGKTTLINQFGKLYDDYLYFNLERKGDRKIFNEIDDLEATIQNIFIQKSIVLDSKRVQLIFIDEVQEVPEVLEQLRYFYEDYPYLHIIVTGSLLEFGMEKVEKTPVGRVEYQELYPISFKEYLQATNKVLLDQIENRITLSKAIMDLCFEHFNRYSLIGGMPEITASYINSGGNLSQVLELYDSLIKAYKSDVEKYASNSTVKHVIRHIINTAPYEVDNRIKLSNFGHSDYRSREVKEGFDLLQKAGLMQLVYPTTRADLPATPDLKKSPRLHFLDIGLVNFQLGLHSELLTLHDLNDASRGKLLQQVVYQEMIANGSSKKISPRFWVREDRTTNAEVDIVYPYNNLLLPIEIKSGASGSLRSLHEYMDKAPHNYALRLYRGPIQIDELTSRLGKKYKLLNLPYYLAGWIGDYIEKVMEE